ncbi:hypothetical protein [Candidatus Ichthyocystis hellenicum]|nr:hypothetical protein [Candidatus Ichthyocystis hellenicum]
MKNSCKPSNYILGDLLKSGQRIGNSATTSTYNKKKHMYGEQLGSAFST